MITEDVSYMGNVQSKAGIKSKINVQGYTGALIPKDC